ncbi:MAG TPA: BMP family ABC transporter substrate-binding protein [Clostridia bacterium]|nr:BMP family ABC transporter substrate-binding protein [Clostridia bacterium]
MKKVVTILLILGMMLSVVACAPAAAPAATEPAATEAPATEATEAPATEATEAPVAINVAMVTDVGNIDDKSFNEFTWKGCSDWATENGMVANYYRPSEDSDEARIETIKTAIDKGANVIVCPGYLFGATYQQLPQQYPEVMFLGIDLGIGDVPEPQANTALITYQEEQSGFLAGYAAVMDGYTKLAFLGGIDVPAVVRYGFGFVQGANQAATELGNTADVSVKYWYSGTFGPNDEIKTKTAGWYTEGTQIIFACGGGIVYSAITSADEANGKLIGVDVDQANISERVVTSAKKELENSVKLALSDLLANGGKWSAAYAGVENKLGAAQDCVGLPTDPASWRFTTFTLDQYNALYAKVKGGEYTISSAIDVQPTVTIAVDYQN